MAWDDLTRDGGTWADPGPAYYALLVRALPESYDRDPVLPPNTYTKALCYAIGRELMRLRYALDWLAREGSAASTVERLADWESLLGLAVRPDLDADTRRALVLERYAGRKVSPGLYLLTIALREMDPSDLEVIPRLGRWLVYRIPVAGWPGTENIVRTERHLARSGSAGFGKFILAWDDVLGLTGEQIDILAGAALDLATGYELDANPALSARVDVVTLSTMPVTDVDTLPVWRLRP